MRRLRIILLLLMITSRSAFAFDMKIDTIVVNYDTCQVQQIIVTIYNSNSETCGYGMTKKTMIKITKRL